MKSYNEIIRELREDNDKTQKEMPIRHIISLCKYYNVSSDYILGLTSKL